MGTTADISRRNTARGGGAGRPRWTRAIVGWTGASLLLALYAAMALTATRDKTVTFDETAHLPAGVAYWTLNRYDLNPENGNLPQRWGTLPLV